MKKIAVLFLLICVSVSASSFAPTPSWRSMVVYGENMAYVQERHAISLDKGRSSLSYKKLGVDGVLQSAQLKLPDGARVVQENFQNNTPTLQRMLRATIGKKVGYDKRQVTLLSASGLDALVQDTHGKIFSVKATQLHFFSLPALFTTQPLLRWEVVATKQIQGEASLGYLLRNISWNGEYFFYLKKGVADLTGWMAILNKTDKTYKNSTLFVVAGTVATGRVAPKNLLYLRAASVSKIASTPLQGYHIYALAKKVDIAAQSTTRIKFLQKKGLAYQKKYIVIVPDPRSFVPTADLDVTQYIVLNNKDFILPAGEVAVYSDDKNSTVFLGQTQIPHTPKATQLKLKIGKAFDLHVSQDIVRRATLKTLIDTKILYTVQNSGEGVKSVSLKIPFIQAKHFHIKTSKPYTLQEGYAVFKVKIKGKSKQSFAVEFEGKK